MLWEGGDCTWSWVEDDEDIVRYRSFTLFVRLLANGTILETMSSPEKSVYDINQHAYDFNTYAKRAIEHSEKGFF